MQEQARRGFSGRTAAIFAAAWICVTTLYFVNEALTSTGLVGWLNEWEFARFDRAYPALNIGLPVFILAVPLLFLWLAGQREIRKTRETLGEEPAAIASSTYLQHALMIVAGGLGTAAVIVLILGIAQPRFGAPPRMVVVGSPGSVSPVNGPTLLEGYALFNKSAILGQDKVVSDQDIWFAPMVAQPGPQSAISYFVALSHAEKAQAGNAAVGHRQAGILMRNRMPQSILNLYRAAGYRISPTNYVLFSSPSMMRNSYFLAAIQLALAGLFAMILSFFQHRHTEKTKKAADPAVPATSDAL